LREAVDSLRAKKRGRATVALVPTMGALHDGHLALVREAKTRADAVVASIFVNPTQFGPKEDFAAYPRTLAEDTRLLAAEGCDLVWAPPVEEVYPEGFVTTVSVGGVSTRLEGAARPGHFDGVATVVAKLFAQVRPDVAVFGEKDWQQLAVIRRMARDLDQGVEIVGMPIVREADGLAMSSRNAYLSPEQRREALALSAGLAAAEAAFRGGERDAAALLALARAPISVQPSARIDYLELRDADELTPVDTITRPAVMAMAVFVGTTRLIDNRVFRP
jgi:pantoate--beta-alanine ligase